MDQTAETLPHPLHFHLEAALGWLELGNPGEAAAELSKISGAYACTPDVISTRWRILAMQKDWEGAVRLSLESCALLPRWDFGFVHLSYSLHELKRTREAFQLLKKVAGKFPGNSIIPYNLACYACQLGKSKMAWEYLRQAAQLSGKKEIRERALGDPDLEPMRSLIEIW